VVLSFLGRSCKAGQDTKPIYVQMFVEESLYTKPSGITLRNEVIIAEPVDKVKKFLQLVNNFLFCYLNQ